MGYLFKMAANASNQNKKITYLSKYCFDVDDVDINLYVFWAAEAMCEVIEEDSSHANVVAVKVKVMLTK